MNTLHILLYSPSLTNQIDNQPDNNADQPVENLYTEQINERWVVGWWSRTKISWIFNWETKLYFFLSIFRQFSAILPIPSLFPPQKSFRHSTFLSDTFEKNGGKIWHMDTMFILFFSLHTLGILFLIHFRLIGGITLLNFKNLHILTPSNIYNWIRYTYFSYIFQKDSQESAAQDVGPSSDMFYSYGSDRKEIASDLNQV